MPKKVGTTNWRRDRKQDNLEKIDFRYYIFCEGEQTEPNYFKGFKKWIEENPTYKDAVLIKIEPCAADTMRVIGKAEEYVEREKLKKGQIWCVYDKDSFDKGNFNAVEERAKNLNKQNSDLQYHAAWSNECIEIWFVLHFSNYVSNNHRTEYIKFLNEKFEELNIGKYEKNNSDIFDILLNNGNPRLAIRYAKRIITENKGRCSAVISPGTMVYKLVEELIKYLPNDIKKKFK